jgi:hypothetical protein
VNLGVRSILILVAVVLFLLAWLSDERYADLLALGLAAFAASFVVDDLPIGGKRRP